MADVPPTKRRSVREDDSAPTLPPARPYLRICTYNIFEGLDGRTEQRIASFKTWIQEQDLDVVGLNEVNGFTPACLGKISEDCGLTHCHFQAAPTGFHLGIMSRHPLRVIDTSSLCAQMHHGLLHAVMDLPEVAYHVLVTHLTPFEASRRRLEAQAIAEYIQPLLERGEPLVLLGDLNNLSRLDRVAHGHERLLPETIAHVSKLRRKFCDEAGEVDYRPIDILCEGGLWDAAQRSGCSTSVPTPANRDDAHIDVRLDYIFLSMRCGDAQSIEEGVGIEVVKDDATDYISDHYPVILQLSSQWFRNIT